MALTQSYKHLRRKVIVFSLLPLAFFIGMKFQSHRLAIREANAIEMQSIGYVKYQTGLHFMNVANEYFRSIQTVLNDSTK